jgi:protocatechuate 3,4-dioxygenase beta subunit
MTDTPQHTRRTVLRLSAATGAGVAGAWALGITDLANAAVSALPSSSARLADAAITGCTTLTVAETQGPFWVDEKLNRSDVRADSTTGAVQSGVPLTLTITLADAGADCAPRAGAYVDIWHASAQGAYSDVSGSGNPNNIGVDWLRGYQVSDENGQVTFTTIWPGYYTGRTIHIHFRVRLSLDSSTTVNFTSQLYFDEANNAAVLATAAYQKAQARDTTNATDSIYDSANVVPVTGSVASGYTGAFQVNLDFGDGASGGSGSGSSGSTDSTVQATLLAATVVRRSTGRRVVRARFRNAENVTVRYRLIRGDDVLVQKRYGWLVPGQRVLRLVVPRGTKAGPARVQLKMTDEAGNTKFSMLRVHIPKR